MVSAGPLGFQESLRLQGTGPDRRGPGRWQGPAEPQGWPAAEGGAQPGSWRWKLELCWGLREEVV